MGAMPKEDPMANVSPVLDLTTADNAAPQERMDLFTLDGRTYDIPAEPKASVALRYLRNLRRHGEEYAAAVMLEELIGEDAYTALIDAEIDMKDFQSLMLVVQKHMMGAIEAAQGNGDAG